MTGSIRALRERNAADRAAYAAEILARAAELEDDPIAMNDALLAEPSPPVRSAEPGAAILHRVRNNEPAAAADEAAALDPAIDAVLWLIAEERAARRKIAAEFRAALAELRAMLDMLGAERAKPAEVIALPKRDAS